MRLSRLLLAVILVLGGLVWIGQGIGMIGGSFMTGSSTWAVIGAIVLLVGLAIGVREWLTHRNAQP